MVMHIQDIYNESFMSNGAVGSFEPIQGELQLVGGGNLHHCHVIQLIKIHAIHGYPTHISASQCRAVRQLIHTLCRWDLERFLYESGHKHTTICRLWDNALSVQSCKNTLIANGWIGYLHKWHNFHQLTHCCHSFRQFNIYQNKWLNQ